MNAEWFAPRPMTSKASQMPRAEIWGQNKTAPGRGGGPGACLSEALGGNRARRGNGTGIRGHDALSASEGEDGVAGAMLKMQITHACTAKTHARRRNLWNVNIKRRGGLTQIPLWL